MARLYLVRHGRASAGFSESHDPGLDDVGHEQADAVARELEPHGPLAILTSPLKRARETSAPLARLWNMEPVVEAAVAEIPSPTSSLEERAMWLRNFMAGSWRHATPPLAQWREDAIAVLLGVRGDSVIFTHYIAINVAAGAATGNDNIVVFSPDNTSVTIFENDDNMLRLIEKGREAPLTRVN